MENLKLIPSKYYLHYSKKQPISIKKHFDKIKNQDIDFGYAISVSAVSSSQIEGNLIDLDTYYKYEHTGMNTKSKEFREIKALEKAYDYARNHALTLDNLLKCHAMMSDPGISEKKYRGKFRDKKVYVMAGREPVYEGAHPEILSREINALFHDIRILRKRGITSIGQVFYFASFIHLIFVAIHPFADGNGRAARLLEKWFLADKLGNKAWFINSEKLYLKRAKSYHKNINKIGEKYSEINYGYSLPFLKMLPMALRIKP